MGERANMGMLRKIQNDEQDNGAGDMYSMCAEYSVRIIIRIMEGKGRETWKQRGGTSGGDFSFSWPREFHSGFKQEKLYRS